MDKMIILFIIIAIKGYGYGDKFNLALRKRVYLSSLGVGCDSKYAVDGNIGQHHIACANKSLEDQWLTVDLGRPYQIDHIVIFPSEDIFNRLVSFLHNLHNITKEQRRNHPRNCKTAKININGNDNGPLTEKHECTRKNEYNQYVTIQQNRADNNGLEVFELQAFGQYIEYTGCYEQIMVDNVTEVTEVRNIETCLKNCENRGTTYAALKNGTMCFCGDDIKGSQPLSKCNILCDNAIDYCGGEDQYSVYFVFPYRPLERTNHEYMGCFRDSYFYRDLNFKTAPYYMTADHCHQYCASLHQNFFGLQSGGECRCDTKYGYISQNDETLCNTSCIIMTSQYCGGHNINSVYYIKVKVGGFNFRRCKNGEKPDAYDICKECDDGWTGESCSIKDCSKNNGDCKSHKCVSALVYRQNVSECVCNNGFSKLSWSEDCQDVDECNNTFLCKFDVARCYNTIGSFNCICLKDGMKYNFTTETCDDADECATSCKSDGAQCYNAIGSYNCICSDGMKYNFTTDTCNDVDECVNTSLCELEVTKCYNTIGSYSCVCLDDGMDYDITTETCNDVDECFIGTALCNFEGVSCLNTIGSYECICLEDGMIFNKTSNTCKALDIKVHVNSNLSIGFYVIIAILVLLLAVVLISLLPSKRLAHAGNQQ